MEKQQGQIKQKDGSVILEVKLLFSPKQGTSEAGQPSLLASSKDTLIVQCVSLGHLLRITLCSYCIQSSDRIEFRLVCFYIAQQGTNVRMMQLWEPYGVRVGKDGVQFS